MGVRRGGNLQALEITASVESLLLLPTHIFKMALTFAESIHTCGAKALVKDFYSV